MSTVIKNFGIGNLVNIICIIFAAGLAWGKIENTIDEFKTLRDNDMQRIQRIEYKQESLAEKVSSLEKNEGIIKNDLGYIKQSIDEVKSILKK